MAFANRRRAWKTRPSSPRARCGSGAPASKDAGAASRSSRRITSWTCDGYTWRVGICNGIEICADCSAICTCDSGLSIRPCINNNNWGGYGTTCSVRPIVCALGSICADRSLLFRRQAAKPCPSRSTLKPRHRYQHLGPLLGPLQASLEQKPQPFWWEESGGSAGQRTPSQSESRSAHSARTCIQKQDDDQHKL